MSCVPAARARRSYKQENKKGMPVADLVLFPSPSLSLSPPSLLLLPAHIGSSLLFWCCPWMPVLLETTI